MRMPEARAWVAFAALASSLLLGPAAVLLLAEGSGPASHVLWSGLVNDVFVGFVVTSMGMILLLLAYGDNRDRPAAPVLGLSMLLVVSFLLGLWLLQSGDFMGDASSPLARFFTELVHLAPVGLALALATPVSLLIAALGLRTFTLDEAEEPRS